jgi:hypothetical protein
VRKGSTISQKIVRHIGVAYDDDELEKLKLLAESIKLKLEAQQQMFLIPPEELARKNLEAKAKRQEITEEDYKVNIKDLEEEQRACPERSEGVVSGIHDVYGKLFHELGYDRVIKNPARHKASVKMFENIVLARIANPASKRASVRMLEENFGVSLNLENVYRMMDKRRSNRKAEKHKLYGNYTAYPLASKIGPTSDG